MKAIALTDVGRRRQVNQDYVFVSKEPVGNLPNLFIVADGMGGHRAGDYASRLAVRSVLESIRGNTETNPVKLLRTAIEYANKEVLIKAAESPDYDGMGTTFVAATIMYGYTYIANVGDSRCYVVNREEIRQVTVDHSLVEEMIRMGEIRREEARFHPDKNIITRAVGAGSEVKVDFFGHKLRDGDRLLMCTDGLTNMVDETEIFAIINTEDELGRRAGELIGRANLYGGKDNISVILIEPEDDEVKKC